MKITPSIFEEEARTSIVFFEKLCQNDITFSIYVCFLGKCQKSFHVRDNALMNSKMISTNHLHIKMATATKMAKSNSLRMRQMPYPLI